MAELENEEAETNVIDFFGENRPLESKPLLHVSLERAVAKLEGMTPNMAGYVVVAVDVDGCYSIGWRYDENSPIKRRMLGTLAAEAVREALITEAAIEDVIFGEP